MITKKEFGNRLKAARKMRGWSQQKLADEADTHQSRIADWENGRFDIFLWAAARLAVALNVSTDYLAGLSDELEVQHEDQSSSTRWLD